MVSMNRTENVSVVVVIMVFVVTSIVVITATIVIVVEMNVVVGKELEGSSVVSTA